LFIVAAAPVRLRASTQPAAAVGQVRSWLPTASMLPRVVCA
jgi:hypothetical protein